MKKLQALGAGLLACAALLEPASAQVYSQNAVGYVKVEVPRGTLSMLRNDFKDMEGETLTPDRVFGNTLPVDTKVYVWDASQQNYLISTYRIEVGPPPTFTTTTNWSSDALVLERGVGFWLQIPQSAPSTNYTVYLMGEVPNDQDATISIEDGLNLIAYSYPVEVTWTNSNLAKSAVVDDAVYYWDDSIQNYYINRYRVEVGPPPTFTTSTNWSIPEMVIPAGKGFWFLTSQTNVWTENKPYAYP